MKILLDNIIFSLQKAGGISVYWSEILKRMLLDEEFDMECYEMKNALTNFFRPSLKIDSEKIIQEKSFLTQLNRMSYVFKSIGEPHIFHSSYYRRPFSSKNACVVTTMHDFTPEIMESGWKKRVVAMQKYNSIKTADAIVCVSQNTREDLLKLYPEFSEKKIEVIYNGVSEEFMRLEKINFSIENKFPEINSPYCIFIGKRNGYKNFKFAVEYIASKRDLFLVVVGGGKLSKNDLALLESKLPSRYLIKSFLSNEDLNLLYNFADFLFYPSDYEGFGISVIEAQKCGCPIIAQKTSSINELIPDKNLLFTQLDLDQIDAVYDYILKNREKVINQGIENVKEFSWKKTFAQHKDLYQTLYNRKFG